MIDDLFAHLMSLAVSIATLGNLALLIWSLGARRLRSAVLSVLGIYVIVCAVVLGVLVSKFFHGLSAPHVTWIMHTMAVLGVAIFVYLLRLMLKEPDTGSGPG